MSRILIVDDSFTIRSYIREMMDGLGFEIAEATTGVEALEECARLMPSGIITDWKMPVMGGIEFVEKLRRLPYGENPAVVFCTGETDIEHISRAIDAGANEFIMKPFDREVLLSRLSQVGLLTDAERVAA